MCKIKVIDNYFTAVEAETVLHSQNISKFYVPTTQYKIIL